MTSSSTSSSASSSDQLLPKTCKAYDIDVLVDASEEKENEGMPDSHFFPKEGDTIIEKEKGVRELKRRYGKRKAELEYAAELAAEAKHLRRMLGCDEEAVVHAVGVPKKVQYHFTDQDGKQYVSLVKDVNKSSFKKSMAFLRMMDETRILELCTDDTHIVLDVAHCREWFLSKSNLSISSLAPHWSTMDLWNTIVHFPVMTPEKFSCLLLFNASYECLEKFSLSDFLKSTTPLDSIDMLKITLDNLQTVYQCIFGSDYRDICMIAKSFWQTNVRYLDIREFTFVLDTFNKAFINFQVDMRNRSVEVPNTTPLNTHKLVVECFIQWFTFNTGMFTQEAEAVYKNRPRFTKASLESKVHTDSNSGSGGKVGIRSVSNKTANMSNSVALSNSNKSQKGPCIRHIAQTLGIKELGGENPVICKQGVNCRFAHISWPIGKFQRKKLIEFISTSSIGLLLNKSDKDLILKKL